MKGRIGKGLGILLIAVAGVALFTYEPPEPEELPPPVRPAKTMLLESPEQASLRNYPGRLQATDEVDLAFRVDGPLIELPVKAADQVEKGALLARIDPRDFEVRVDRIEASLDEARAALAAMRIGARPEDIRILEADLSAARSRLERAQLEYDRAEDLLKSGAGTRQDFDAKKASLDVATERAKSAQEALNKGRAGARKEDLDAQEAKVKGLEASLREAQNALRDTELHAPFAGRIARTYVENFQDVRRKERILSLQDISEIEIVADLPESVMSELNRENIEKITVEILGRTFDAKFSEAEIEADRRTQTYAVTFVMPARKELRLLPGMTATVRLHLKAGAAADHRWYVPADAVYADEAGQSYLWKVTPQMTVTRAPVKVGDLRDDRIEVLEGVQAGDRIVTAGVSLLREGLEIRLLEANAP